MKILVCGGRDFKDWALLEKILDQYLERVPHIIHGDAKGADSLSDNWAYLNNLPCTRYPALWKKHGKAAGPIRNQQMLDESDPDLVIAFPGGVGTADMISRARKASVPVIEVEKENKEE